MSIAIVPQATRTRQLLGRAPAVPSGDAQNAALVRKRYCQAWHRSFQAERRQYALQHPECVAQLLRDRRRYLADVLAHAEPSWWLDRQTWHHKRDWLLPLCDVCKQHQVLPGQAAARTIESGAVRCDGCIETWRNCREALA